MTIGTVANTAKKWSRTVFHALGVGVGAAALNPAALSMLSDYFPRRTRGRALTFYNYDNEAVYTLYEGVGNVRSIDESLRLGANHPMGPLELADFIGLDTCLSVMQVLHEGLADSKYRPCPLLVKYVEAGWLGRKTQRGFYDYRGEKPVPTR